jgi:hypothetical protein
MSKSHTRRNNVPTSSAFETFASSRMVISSVTMTHHWNMRTASTSPSKGRRKMRRTTRQPRWHQATSRCAQSKLLQPLFVEANDNTSVSVCWKYDCIDHITSKQILNALKDAVSAIGEDSLHIAANEIGTHSIRLGAAMAMFLGGCPVFLIMMVGRWSSDAFLATFGSRSKNSTTTSPRRCSLTCFAGTSPTTPPKRFPISIPNNATISTML